MAQPLRTWRRWTAILLLAGIAALLAPSAGHANETDQFLMPEEKNFVDIEHMINIVHYRALRKVVDRANANIARASESARQQHYDPGQLARQLQMSFGPGFFEMMDLEDALRLSSANRLRGENEVIAHRPLDWIYFFAHMPFDPRNSVLLFQSSTILVDGVYMGVDKWGHFHDLGNIYFQDYLRLRKNGKSEAEAVETVVRRFSRGVISEAAVIGKFATGVQSNGDLAANYAGFRFYDNMTRPIEFNGQKLPALLVRHGAFWRLNDHVRPDANFMSAYISDHWNEALNPGRIELGMRVAIKRRLRDNSERVLNFYTRDGDHVRGRAYFEQLATSLQTFNGESYGYLPISDDEATIASACFDDEDDIIDQYAAQQAREQVQMRQVRMDP